MRATRHGAGLAVASLACAVGLAGGASTEWVHSSHPANAVDVQVSGVAVGPGGHVYATGTFTLPGNNAEGLLLVLNPAGALLNSSFISGAPGSPDRAADVRATASGAVYVAGSLSVSPTDVDLFVARYDANGSMDWMRTYGTVGGGIDEANDLDVDAAGNAYVIGRADIGVTDDIVLIKYLPGGGVDWTRSSDTSGPARVFVDPFGNTHVADALTVGNISFAVRTAKYDSAGALVWQRFDDLEPIDLAAAITVNTGGDVYSVINGSGGASFRGVQYRVQVLRFGSGGTRLWSRILDLAPAGLVEEVHASGTDAAGNLYLAGTANDNLLLLKYTVGGVLAWVRQDFPGDARAVAVDAAGNAYVGGMSNDDWLLAKYDTDGALQWQTTRAGAGGGPDSVAGMDLDQDGKLHVAGATIPSPGILDVTVVRFRDCDVVCMELPGDMNCDGLVSVTDIGPFVLALTNPSGYGDAYPDCRILNGDLTADEQVSVGDIGGFVDLLTGG